MNRIKTVFVVALLAAAPVAYAGKCIANDPWTGRDKAMHLKAGLLIGGSVTLLSKEPDYGFWAGTAAGLAAEIKDARTPGHVCSFQDFAVTALGAAAGAYGTSWVILPMLGRDGRPKGVQLAFSKRL